MGMEESEYEICHHECMFCGKVTKSSLGIFDKDKLFEMGSSRCPVVCETCLNPQPCLTCAELREKLAVAQHICQKFVDKVESGRARSKETYGDCKAFLTNTPTGLVVVGMEDLEEAIKVLELVAESRGGTATAYPWFNRLKSVLAQRKEEKESK